METMFQNIDYRGNNKINYTEFIAASLSLKKVLSHEKMWQLFKHFDVDDTDYITPNNLK